MMTSKLPDEEILKIASSLEDYHAIFYKFFTMSSVGFTDVSWMKTAMVKFNQYGNPDLLINKDFWYSLTDREQLFVVCHECLHVLLDHGNRRGSEIKGATPRLINVAQDITINEMIVSLFGYDRNDLRNWDKFCWIDTCFEDPSKINRNETFLYYLQLLVDQQKQNQQNGKNGQSIETGEDGESGDGDGLPELFDEHHPNEMNSSGSSEEDKQKSESIGKDGDDKPKPETKEEKEAKEKLAKELFEELNTNQLNKMKNNLKKAGNMESIMDNIIKSKIKVPRLKITKLIKNLRRKSIGNKTIEALSFAREERRFTDIISTRPDISLPGIGEFNKRYKNRLLTAVFMDVSGSCVSYFNIFEKVFLAFDADKSTFDVRGYAFDTRVKKIQPGKGVKMGGGTNFEIIENEILKLQNEAGKYPDCVIVITDGEGNKVDPKHPDRWIWLMTEEPSYYYIPKKSKTALIKDVLFE